MGCFRRLRMTINRWVDKYIRKKPEEERKSAYENDVVSELVRITGDKTNTSQINDVAPEHTEITERNKNAALRRANYSPEGVSVKNIDSRKNISLQRKKSASEQVRLTEGQKNISSARKDYVLEHKIYEGKNNTSSERKDSAQRCDKITKGQRNISPPTKDSVPEPFKNEGQKISSSVRKDSASERAKITGQRNVSSPTKDSAPEHMKKEGRKDIASTTVDSTPEHVRINEDKKDTYSSPATDSAPGHVKKFEGHKTTTLSKASQTYLSADYNYSQPLVRLEEKNIRGILIKRTSAKTKRTSVKKVRFLIQEDQFEDSVSKFPQSREDKGARARKSGYEIPVDEAWPLYHNSTKPCSPIETRIQPTKISERPGTNNNAEMDIDDAIADIFRNMDE